MRYDLHGGDCLDMLRSLAPESIDALVTDPPSGIGFMGAEWDSDRGGRDHWIAWLAERLSAASGAMKPGAHGLVWALPRTSHWTMLALENAGLEIRDVVTHMFATGYPKSTDLGGGLGTALKPASEHWILCRKPIEGTIADNLAEHGTGALRIDAARVPLLGESAPKGSGNGSQRSLLEQVARSEGNGGNETPAGGRWPANVVFSHAEECVEVGAAKVQGSSKAYVKRHAADSTSASASIGRESRGVGAKMTGYASEDGDETVPLYACVPGCPVRELDDQAGLRSSGEIKPGTMRGESNPNALSGFRGPNEFEPRGASTGRASRFYFVAKPSRADKNRGISPDTLWRRMRNGLLEPVTRGEWAALPLKDRAEMNAHPTVKSVALARWLTRLVAAPGQVVCDPFTGSGTGGVAAIEEGCSFIGCEGYEPYRERIARPRIAWAASVARSRVRPEKFAGVAR